MVTMLEICTFNVFYQQIHIGVLNWCHVKLRYVYMTKSCQFSGCNTHSYFGVLCIDEMSLSGIVHIEDILWKTCEGNVLRKSSTLSFSLCCKD